MIKRHSIRTTVENEIRENLFYACEWDNYIFHIKDELKILKDEEMGYYIKTGIKEKIPMCCILFFAINYVPFLNEFLDYEYDIEDNKSTGIIPCTECLDAILKDLN